MASWIRCETCRRVLATDAFDEGQTTCRSCLTEPAPKVRKARASAVKTVRPAAPAPVARGPLLGVAGSGDLEMRERRARRAALESLAEMHATDFEELLATARQSEGLRA
ncbi:MAG TPA: hypothetical protein VM097_13395 [Mycobacteriales bacterium]|nr:hypothetical protein [Mycobacteriales bacterium]